MPNPTLAIPGQANLDRKRQREKRRAEADLSTLPDWMFWGKAQMDARIDAITNLDDVKTVLKAQGHFNRIVIRLLEKYEDRP